MRRCSTPQAWALRCRIILACATGASNKDVAAQLGSTPHAVGRWRLRFVEHRIAGLGDMPRSGGPRTVTDDQVEAVVKRTLETTPKNATHWSTRAMAKELGLSWDAVHRGARRCVPLRGCRRSAHAGPGRTRRTRRRAEPVCTRSADLRAQSPGRLPADTPHGTARLSPLP
ncbi:helix-turn-helix domain-containing protein [Streptomyces sp. V4I8]|uniref:helix-turn-helix domain-containing protein n=1 Tax=Streptomyces sp. V4I8 TaxID=3156469 RepID=UPI0035182A50